MNATKFDRADAIRRIVADNLNYDGGGMEAWFESILRTGFKGYENMTDDELAAELADLGLADRLETWSVIYKFSDEHLLPRCITVTAADASEAEEICEQHNPRLPGRGLRWVRLPAADRPGDPPRRAILC